MTLATRVGAIRFSAAFSIAVGVAACTAPSTTPPNPPNGKILLDAGPRFRLDTSSENHKSPVEGMASASLEAVLVDGEGRRAIYHSSGIEGEARVLVAPGNWHLPPAAATNDAHQPLVCWNHLAGADSELTEGTMPDPTQGVALWCRMSRRVGNQTQQSDRFQVAANVTAAWLRDVTAAGDTFHITYYADNGWLLTPSDPTHAYYLQTYNGTSLSAPTLLKPGCPN